MLLAGAVKNEKLRWRAHWRDWRENKTVQAVVLAGAVGVLIPLSFLFLCSLVGAAVAAIAMLLVLEKVLGFKIVGPYRAF